MNDETTQKLARMTIGGVEITPANTVEIARRVSLLLWGPSGCGKTTLAATLPGKKLLLNFDPDGPASISNFDDVDVADLSGSPHTIAEQAKRGSDPFGLKRVIDEYDSFIVDSMTNFTFLSLMQGISGVKGATIERPSPGAYQVRNALALQLTKNVLRITGKHGKHCAIICHEAAPVTNDEGMVLFITLMLGGQLPEQTGVDFSETWYMNDTGKVRRIAVRPVRQRKPMKTRMFSIKEDVEFVWEYDAETRSGDGIAEWYEQWKANNFAKIPLPKPKKAPAKEKK